MAIFCRTSAGQWERTVEGNLGECAKKARADDAGACAGACADGPLD